MSEGWKRWEGQVVNGALPLVRYLGGSDHSAVFLTERVGGSPQKAAIKLIAADAGAEEQLTRWKQAAKLTHPNLIRVFESGRCELEGTALLYVVMELAEEDLSQIVPERALTVDEARAMLPTVLKALAHVHSKGLVQGRIRPSNILAAGDQVKVASDTVRAVEDQVTSPPSFAKNAKEGWGTLEGTLGIYDPPEMKSGKLSTASDVWLLGVTLCEVLTQRVPTWDRSSASAPKLPEGLPQPFEEIVRRCLVTDPQLRWSIGQIGERLQPEDAAVKRAVAQPGAVRAAERKPAAWPYVLALVVIALIGWALMSGPKKQSPSATDQATSNPPAAAKPEPAATPREAKPTPARAGKKTPLSGRVTNGTVAQRVMPQVSASARETIEGKIRVTVRVQVDASGNVTNARFETHGPSNYFARAAMEAARQWKFTPAQVDGRAVPSEWSLRFGFRRSDTEVVPTEVSP